jgi:hypothetical protein
MKKIAIAAAACLAAVSFTAPAMADSLVIRVKPAHPVVRKVVIVPRVPVRRVVVAPTCRTKVVKTVSAHKTVIKRTRVCN